LSSYLVFGATGSIGSEIVDVLRSQGNTVVEANRTLEKSGNVVMTRDDWASVAKDLGPFDGLVWAQGINSSETILTAKKEDILGAFEANVVFIAETLKQLLEAGATKRPCRAVVLSSIWQQSSRSSKLAYSISKSALSGLVKSAAIDLAESQLFINAVLPGVLDTKMTRANLTPEQLKSVEHRTLGGSLVTTKEIANVVSWLLSEQSSGVNGEFITVDNGWSVASGL
jgi:NAD(P)-dependent dehydrogenase (short-subunit alcohol dehydrogenase family)